MTHHRLGILTAISALSLGCGSESEVSKTTGDVQGLEDRDGDGYAVDEDCDDADPEVNPDATERCDEVDNNCDGFVDEGLTNLYWEDADGDGFGDPAVGVETCTRPEGFTDNADDCDDLEPRAHPDATEVCDGIDNDCDALIDDEDESLDSASAERWFHDIDADGFGDPDSSVLACSPPEGTVYDNTDCDDNDNSQNPDADEYCNDEDDDCDGTTDEDDALDALTWYADTDGDGFGDAASSYVSCSPPTGYGQDASDCDDADPAQFPGADEYCNGEDDDCDGTTDEDDAIDAGIWFTDADGDGFGLAGTDQQACEAPSGTVDDNTDCDDTDADINPDATEVCDGIDNDCDSSTTEAGMVTYTDTTGTYDVTSSFTGTAGSPAWLAVTGDADLWFCPGTYYAHFEVEANVNFASLSGDPADVTIDAEAESSVFNIETDGLDVELTGLTITDGQGDGTIGGYSNTGGAVNCDGDTAGNSLAVYDSIITGNSGGLGGGIAASECDVLLSATDIESNEADVGGGLLVLSGDIETDEVSISGNTAEDAGGVYHYNGIATLTDTRIDSNSADDVGGWYGLASTASCEATTTGAAGFSDNIDDRLGAVVLNTGSSLELTDCDLGTTAGGDDNSPFDILTADLFEYRFGDARTETCDDERCGTSTTDEAGGTSESFSGTERLRGNIEVVSGTPTIDDFSSYLTISSSSGSCTLYWYLLTASTASGPWTVEWSDTTSATSGTGWYSSDDVGKVMNDGDYVLLGTAWDDSCTVTYYRDSTGSFGMSASHYGWAYDSQFSPSDYTASTTSAITAVNDSVVYYQRVSWTD